MDVLKYEVLEHKCGKKENDNATNRSTSLSERVQPSHCNHTVIRS